MKAGITMAIFMIGNFLFGQKPEIETTYFNASIKHSGKNYRVEMVNKVIHNYNNVNGDVLLDLNGTMYLFNKVEKDNKGVTDYGYSYLYSTYISNSSIPIIIQKFDDPTQGIRFIVSDDYIIHLF